MNEKIFKSAHSRSRSSLVSVELLMEKFPTRKNQRDIKKLIFISFCSTVFFLLKFFAQQELFVKEKKAVERRLIKM